MLHPKPSTLNPKPSTLNPKQMWMHHYLEKPKHLSDMQCITVSCCLLVALGALTWSLSLSPPPYPNLSILSTSLSVSICLYLSLSVSLPPFLSIDIVMEFLIAALTSVTVYVIVYVHSS